VGSYGLLNGRVSFSDVEFAGSTWQFALWARNLADEDSVNYRIGTTSATFLQPRLVGAEVIFEF